MNPRLQNTSPTLGIVTEMSESRLHSRSAAHTGAGAGWQARALTVEEWAESERVAARLQAEFRRLIARLPEHARHASGMSRHLNVLRVTCQRVVSALQEHPPTPQLLARLPGVEGLRQVLEGFRSAGTDRTDIETAEAAVVAFERFIKLSAGSHSRLVERLRAGSGASGWTGESASGFAAPAQREALHRAAVGVTGRSCQTAISIYAFREDPGTGMLDRGMVKGMIGNRLLPGGMPMVLNSGDLLRGEDEVRQLRTLNREEVKGRTPEAILKAFTTDPLPSITSRQRGGTLMQYVDSSAAAGQPFDLVTALRGRNPVFDDRGNPSLQTVWSLVNCAAERLILDVWLHADMERKYRPGVDAQLWNPGLVAPADERWALMLPAQPGLQLLGRGAARSASEFYPRQSELTRSFFAHMGWESEEFVGFRCEVRYPIWRAGYCMAFDYSGPPPTS